MNKRILSPILILVMLFSLVGCGDGGYSHAELHIGLPENFEEIENENFDKTYTDGTSVVAILRLSFVACYNEGIPETMTPYEFGDFWLKKCGRVAYMQSEGEVSYATYYDGIGADEHFYLEAFYRSHYAYFVVLFATNAERAEEAFDEFLVYADSVYFENKK